MIPEAKYTIGDKVFVSPTECMEVEYELEGIVSGVSIRDDKLSYTVFVLSEDEHIPDFAEDALSLRVEDIGEPAGIVSFADVVIHELVVLLEKSDIPLGEAGALVDKWLMSDERDKFVCKENCF